MLRLEIIDYGARGNKNEEQTEAERNSIKREFEKLHKLKRSHEDKILGVYGPNMMKEI